MIITERMPFNTSATPRLCLITLNTLADLLHLLGEILSPKQLLTQWYLSHPLFQHPPGVAIQTAIWAKLNLSFLGLSQWIELIFIFAKLGDQLLFSKFLYFLGILKNIAGVDQLFQLWYRWFRQILLEHLVPFLRHLIHSFVVSRRVGWAVHQHFKMATAYSTLLQGQKGHFLVLCTHFSPGLLKLPL